MYRNDGLQFVYIPSLVRGSGWWGEHSRPCSICTVHCALIQQPLSAGHRSRNWQKHSLEADTTTCRSNLVNHEHILNLTRIYLNKHANCMNDTFFKKITSTTFCIILMLAINKITYILYVNWLFLFLMMTFLYSHDRTYSEHQWSEHHWQCVSSGPTVEFSVADFIM